MRRAAGSFVPPHANAETHVRVMRALSKATPKQLVQSLVDAGIVNSKGKLTAPYRAGKVPQNGKMRRKNSRAVSI